MKFIVAEANNQRIEMTGASFQSGVEPRPSSFLKLSHCLLLFLPFKSLQPRAGQLTDYGNSDIMVAGAVPVPVVVAEFWTSRQSAIP